MGLKTEAANCQTQFEAAVQVIQGLPRNGKNPFGDPLRLLSSPIRADTKYKSCQASLNSHKE